MTSSGLTPCLMPNVVTERSDKADYFDRLPVAASRFPCGRHLTSYCLGAGEQERKPPNPTDIINELQV